MLSSEALRVCTEVARVLDELRVPFLVGGSIASSLHGVPRSTQDADVVADLRQEHVPAFLASLEGRFYVDQERVRDAVRRRTSFNVIDLATLFKVDLFLLRDEPLARQEMARRESVDMPDGSTLPVASAEDTVLQKLRWYRLGGDVSERQWRDVASVLQVQGERLDREYLARGATALEVDDLLAKALVDAGLSG